jgi:uncharacterized protein YkwD
MKRNTSIGLPSAVMTLAAVVCTTPASLQAQQLVPMMEAPIVAWTNLARQQHGVLPVRPNALLTRAAQMHALTMAAQEKMSHTLNGTTPADRVRMVGYPYECAGENVAFNFGYPNPDWKLFEGWMNSPGHFQNIVNGQFTEIGVAVACSASGKFYACQVFGRPQGLMVPPPYAASPLGGYRPMAIPAVLPAAPRDPAFFLLTDP